MCTDTITKDTLTSAYTPQAQELKEALAKRGVLLHIIDVSAGENITGRVFETMEVSMLCSCAPSAVNQTLKRELRHRLGL